MVFFTVALANLDRAIEIVRVAFFLAYAVGTDRASCRPTLGIGFNLVDVP